MTKERAIELLKNFNQYDEPNCMGYWDCDECVEALYMGIEAIEQQSKKGKWVHKQVPKSGQIKIGDEVYVHGYIDEIRNDTVIIRNKGGYFGTVKDEIRTEGDE